MSLSQLSFAGHLIGGEMYYNYLGFNNYEIITIVYRDCLPGAGAALDPSINLTVMDGSGSIINNVGVGIESDDQIDLEANITCLANFPTTCIQKGVYRVVVNLIPQAGGYTVTFQRCCRGAGISNLTIPEDQGMTFSVNIPGPELVPSNNAARFENSPPTLICVNIPFTFDHSASDPDGDQLVYELCTPFQGGSDFNPVPNPSLPPPYNGVVWGNGYSAAFPIDANPAFQIDPNTGIITGTPTVNGNYVVGVCVKEFRNGVQIGQTIRDYRFTASVCEVDAAASIPEQTDFCSGLTLEFDAGASLGSSFWWNFGDTMSIADTAFGDTTSYTYPEPGFYTITMIAIGGVCQDTAYLEYQAIRADSAHFRPVEGQCLEGNEFLFEQDGYSNLDATFLWEFGEAANEDSLTVGNPPGITFDEAGTWPVTLNIYRDECSYAYTDFVPVWAHPEARFELTDTVGCEPLLIDFVDKSFSESPLLYFYGLGDGDTSFFAEPTKLYKTPGTYQPTLTVVSTDFCIDTSYYELPAAVEVYEVPDANFETDEASISILNPFLKVFNRSTNNDFCSYQVSGDSTIYYDCDLVLEFEEEGKYQIYQEVSTEFGCRDTTFRNVEVLPNRTIWIPNAFSPNNDQINDIWKPTFDGVTGYQLRVYNRFGEQVFSTFREEEGWDGKMSTNGNVAPQGMYTYYIRLINLETNEEEKYYGQFALVHRRN